MLASVNFIKNFSRWKFNDHFFRWIFFFKINLKQNYVNCSYFNYMYTVCYSVTLSLPRIYCVLHGLHYYKCNRPNMWSVFAPFSNCCIVIPQNIFSSYRKFIKWLTPFSCQPPGIICMHIGRWNFNQCVDQF